jgi:hypothetical protein
VPPPQARARGRAGALRADWHSGCVCREARRSWSARARGVCALRQLRVHKRRPGQQTLWLEGCRVATVATGHPRGRRIATSTVGSSAGCRHITTTTSYYYY